MSSHSFCPSFWRAPGAGMWILTCLCTGWAAAAPPESKLRAETSASAPSIVPSPITDRIRLSWVDQRIARLRPKAHEYPFDRIGWTKSLAEGLSLARAHDRPLFLFTHAGHMDRGRC